MLFVELQGIKFKGVLDDTEILRRFISFVLKSIKVHSEYKFTTGTMIDGHKRRIEYFQLNQWFRRIVSTIFLNLKKIIKINYTCDG